MSQQTLKEIYESHVRPLSADERLQLLIMTARDLERDTAGISSRPRRNIMDLQGLGKEIWEGIDPAEYVSRLRDEWDGGN